ncbi:MAG: hypothetical protein MJ146_05620 [Clostridia bacterium]|nr:hypothetical protein [Clostridia bacterium]
MKKTSDGYEINTSESLTKELERESGKEMQRINSTAGITFGNYARKDKSWKNPIDFFKQLAKKIAE